jgi:hypothetical protein
MYKFGVYEPLYIEYSIFEYEQTLINLSARITLAM